MSKLLIQITILFVMCTMTASQLLAVDERLGISTLEEKQRRQAIVSAQSGGHSALETQQAMAIDNASAVSHYQPSEIEINLSKALDPVSLEEEIQQQV